MRTGYLPRFTRKRHFPFAHGGKCTILALAIVGACDERPVSAPTEPAVPYSGPGASLSAAFATDRDILVALYEATDGPNWVNSENWLTDAPLDEWHGVYTDAAGRVTSLYLDGRWDDETRRYVGHGLSGPIPAQLGGLTGLTELDLSINNLSGPIPSELAALANLTTLRLGVNDLSGPIPPQLGNLANLEYLWLGSNDLSGTIPTELATLTNLRNLSIGNNELSGPIPAELGSLANLRHLTLENNRLSGSIPVELAGLTDLSSMSLSDNELRGSIPPQLGRLANLGSLYLSDNELSGSIPAELGDLANLRFLYLRHNALSGTVPSSFLRLSRLSSFGFDGNTGVCIPPNLDAWYEALENQDGRVCPDLEILQALYEDAGGTGWANADGWLGDGPVEEWHGVDIDSTGLVSSIDLEGNGLSGGLPTGLGRLAGLTRLQVGDNALSGRLPVSLSSAPLRELGYANTELCVPVEGWFRNWLTGLPRHEGTSAECPQLSDREILVALYEATGGPDWMDSDNWLTDAPLGEWHGVRTDDKGRVVELDLRLNGLAGSIPADIGGLSELETLVFFWNTLTGPIPPALGELAKLELVVLALNRLSGPIPPELGGMTSLEQFHAHGNELASIPPELGQLDNLEVVNLSSNRLTSIPPELGGLPNLRSMGLSFNWLTSIPPELGNLPELRYLGLWANEITFIPPELGNLSNLAELDLDDNQLTSVPAELGRLDNLEVLWLASNSLQHVPPELGEMDSLAVLNLWGNRLAGMPTRPGDYPNLRILDLSSNEFAFFPSELSGLGNLQQLELDGNRLTDIPPELGNLTELRQLGLGYTELEGSIPSELGNLTKLQHLFLGNSHLEKGIPPELGKLTELRTLNLRDNELDGEIPAELGELANLEFLGLERNRLTHEIPPELGELANLQELLLRGNRLEGPVPAFIAGLRRLRSLDLGNNMLSGPVPPEIGDLPELYLMYLHENPELSGPLPRSLTSSAITRFLVHGTGLCAPDEPAFRNWLASTDAHRVRLCSWAKTAAYLTQAVQSREYPVPLVAGEAALLRVFVTSATETSEALPPVRATFFLEGSAVHVAEIPAGSSAIPTEVREGSLRLSANAKIPRSVIQPGLEMVVEIDPGGTVDPALGVSKRFPSKGRAAVDVRALPKLNLTLIPFVWSGSNNRATATLVEELHPEHELFRETNDLLPVSGLEITKHEPVLVDSNNPFDLLRITDQIRMTEGGDGHWMGLLLYDAANFLSVARPGGKASFVQPYEGSTVAHELGHNFSLGHAPCGIVAGVDDLFPDLNGRIGAWGYDSRNGGSLIPPEYPDVMSYCSPSWISDYYFTQALRYRVAGEGASRAASAPTRSLLVSGRVDADSTLHLDPAFVIETRPVLPSGAGSYALTGWRADGSRLFSLPFDMAEVADGDGRSAFMFALPTRPSWERELARLVLSGPGGSVELRHGSAPPMAMVRDPRTGEVRAILRDLDALGPSPGAEVTVSRGLPEPGQWRR